jgi:hypothetical protein
MRCRPNDIHTIDMIVGGLPPPQRFNVDISIYFAL